jgi:hypothetical protein
VKKYSLHDDEIGGKDGKKGKEDESHSVFSELSHASLEDL